MHLHASNFTDFVECKDDSFVCDNKQCIPKDLACDGDKDCSDGSDELHCDKLNDTKCEVGDINVVYSDNFGWSYFLFKTSRALIMVY